MNTEDPEDKIFSVAIEKKVDEVIDFIKKLPDERKHEVAWRIAFEAINWGSYNYFDAMGIAEDIKLTYREDSRKMIEEEIAEREDDSSSDEEVE